MVCLICTDRLVIRMRQRPPLSKAFLSGNADPTTLEFRSAEHYERERITVLTGQRVTGGRPALGG